MVKKYKYLFTTKKGNTFRMSFKTPLKTKKGLGSVKSFKLIK